MNPNKPITKLEYAALQYLKAIEKDYDDDQLADEAIKEVIDNLKDAAMFWAQGYCIEQEEAKEKDVVRITVDGPRTIIG